RGDHRGRRGRGLGLGPSGPSGPRAHRPADARARRSRASEANAQGPLHLPDPRRVPDGAREPRRGGPSPGPRSRRLRGEARSPGQALEPREACPLSRAADEERALKGRVLVADDEEDLRELYAQALLDAGHQVDMAPDAEAALALIGKATFDVVISD